MKEHPILLGKHRKRGEFELLPRVGGIEWFDDVKKILGSQWWVLFCVAVIFAGFTGGFIWWVRCQASPLARLVYLIHLIWQTQSSRIFVWWRKSLNRNLILVVLYKGCKTSGPVSDRYCQSFFPQKHYSLVLNISNLASIKKNLIFSLISHILVGFFSKIVRHVHTWGQHHF